MDLNQILEGFSNSTLPTDLKDPFSKTKITRISVSSAESIFNKGTFYHTGTIKFQNGNTKGEQSFSEDSFDNVVIKIKSFLEGLKD